MQYVAIVHYVTLQLSVRDVTGVCAHMCTFGKCELLVLFLSYNKHVLTGFDNKHTAYKR